MVTGHLREDTSPFLRYVGPLKRPNGVIYPYRMNGTTLLRPPFGLVFAQRNVTRTPHMRFSLLKKYYV